MKCEHCGSEIAENEKFCGECGAPRPEQIIPPPSKKQRNLAKAGNSAHQIPADARRNAPVSASSPFAPPKTILKRYWKLILIAVIILILQFVCWFQLVDSVKHAIWKFTLGF